MATTPRTIQEITASIVEDVETRPSLAGLTSTSQQAIWRALAFVFGTASNQLENYYSIFESDIEGRAQEIPTGTKAWYSSESLLFQFGDALTFVDGNWTYADTTSEDAADKRIIKFAAVDVNNENLFLKVAKDDGSGLATPLDAGTELVAFVDYWQIKQFPGVNINVVSQSGDLATISYRIGVDANLINPSNGQLYSDNTHPVETAITNYIQSFQSENFNGYFLVNKLTDAIQSVAGVKNVIAQNVTISNFDVLSDSILDRGYLTDAGWIQIDPSTPLRDELTYYDFDNG